MRLDKDVIKIKQSCVITLTRYTFTHTRLPPYSVSSYLSMLLNPFGSISMMCVLYLHSEIWIEYHFAFWKTLIKVHIIMMLSLRKHLMTILKCWSDIVL